MKTRPTSTTSRMALPSGATLLALLFATSLPLRAHPGHSALDLELHQALASDAAATSSATTPPAAGATAGLDFLTAVFSPFRASVRTRNDENYFYLESEGMPTHPVMIGITNWQQQVPLPQNFSGANAFRLPLAPALSSTPFTFLQQPLLNAVAVAVNGVPIFTALNNRGEDSLLIGELDQWGGHCGRADDYHYHVAPLHLTEVVGPARPIAFAFDGFPIFGLTEPDGGAVTGLDAYNGHLGADGAYHYHATRAFPYINGGFRGVVNINGGQVTPQPRTTSPRPALTPLNGATITGFSSPAPDTYLLTYQRSGQTYSITYTADRTARTVTYSFKGPDGATTAQTYGNWSAPPVMAATTTPVTETNPSGASTSGRIINLSIRTDLSAASPTLTLGAVASAPAGTSVMPLLIRAAGPALASFGVAQPLADPVLAAFQGSTAMGGNDDWSGSAALAAAFAQVGAFPFTNPASTDAALHRADFPPGGFTLQVSGKSGGAGTVLAELYDATPSAALTPASPRLVNVSVRHELGASDLIAGLVIGGGATRVLMRAVGPKLTAFGVPNVLADPRLELFDASGRSVASNDNWGNTAALGAAFAEVGAFALDAGSRDAALLATLDSGSYTVQASGVGGTSGTALLEIYEAPASTTIPAEPSPTRSITQGLATTTIANLLDARGGRISGVGTIRSTDGKQWTVPAAVNFTAGPKASDLHNTVASVTPANLAAVNLDAVPIVNVDSDGEVVTGYIFADNYFELYVNGKLVAVDPVPFTPFNSSVVRFRARKPITYAALVVDWEENLGVGTELNGNNAHHPGDGGFVASFSDGTVTNATWKAQAFYISPIQNLDTVVELPDGTRSSATASTRPTSGAASYGIHYPMPENWFAPAFDDSGWPAASVYTEATVGVDNKPAYTNFTPQFGGAGARFIWSSNLVLDNVVLLRTTTK